MPTRSNVRLPVVLAAFGKHGYAVKVEEQNPDTSPGELMVEVWKYEQRARFLGATSRLVFAHAKRQPDGDVVAALTFIREKWIPEVSW